MTSWKINGKVKKLGCVIAFSKRKELSRIVYLKKKCFLRAFQRINDLNLHAVQISFATANIAMQETLDVTTSYLTIFLLPLQHYDAFDLEGWAVGVAVMVTITIVQASRWETFQNNEIVRKVTPILQWCFPADCHVSRK